MKERAENIVYFSARDRRSGQSRRDRKANREEIPNPDRRKVLKWAAGVGLGILAGVGVKKAVDEVFLRKDSPYAGWERYQNSYFPEDAVLEIAKDLASSSQYPGFSEVGNLMARVQRRPEALSEIQPQMIGPLRIRLTNLVQTDQAIGSLEHNLRGQYVRGWVTDKNSGVSKEVIFVNAKEVRLEILFDNSFYLAPDAGKKLIIVKEVSHLLYVDLLRSLIAEEVRRNFDITVEQPSVDLPNFLFINSMLKPDERKMPDLGYFFDNGLFLLDGAGYWHIMPALGKMIRQGLFAQRDLRVMHSDYEAFRAAVSRDWLIERGKGEFVWRRDVGPFHKGWQDVVRPFIS